MEVSSADARVPAAPSRPSSHALLVTATQRECELGTTAWVDRRLNEGAKVYFKGWLEPGQGTEQHWIASTPLVRSALASGQFEFRDLPTVAQMCGGRSEGLERLLRGEVEHAIGQGWASVAMSQESPGLPMRSDEELAEFTAQEAIFDALGHRWPLTTLCQLVLDKENQSAARASVAVHHPRIYDPQWSGVLHGGCWSLSGALDIHVNDLFTAALAGFLVVPLDRGAERSIDVSHVEFFDLTCARAMVETIRTLSPAAPVVLRGCSFLVRWILGDLDLPPSLVVEGGHRR